MSRPISPAVQKLIDAYGKELPTRLRQLQTQAPTNGDVEALKEYGGEVHKLAGSSGSYGFRDISEALRALDRYIADCLAGDAEYSADHDRSLWEPVFVAIADS